jgi:hypothetical protein
MKRLAFIVLAVLAAGASSAGSREKLVVPPYPAQAAWKKITDKGDAQQHLREWIPYDQSEADTHDILTEQVFYAAKESAPALLVDSILNSATQACQRVRVNGPTRQTENGYRVAYAQIYCAHQKGTSLDVDILLKAISGSDAMYVVQREFRRPMEADGMPGVMAFSQERMPEMKARMMSAEIANKYLADAVQLCPPDQARCPANPGPDLSERFR